MELTVKHFNEGIQFLKACYIGLPIACCYCSELKPWYDVIKLDISDEEFMPLLIQYCRTEPAPQCPSDIINFKLKKEQP